MNIIEKIDKILNETSVIPDKPIEWYVEKISDMSNRVKDKNLFYMTIDSLTKQKRRLPVKDIVEQLPVKKAKILYSRLLRLKYEKTKTL